MGIIIKRNDLEFLKKVKVAESHDVCNGKYIKIITTDGKAYYLFPEKKGENYYAVYYDYKQQKEGNREIEIGEKT